MKNAAFSGCIFHGHQKDNLGHWFLIGVRK